MKVLMMNLFGVWNLIVKGRWSWSLFEFWNMICGLQNSWHFGNFDGIEFRFFYFFLKGFLVWNLIVEILWFSKMILGLQISNFKSVFLPFSILSRNVKWIANFFLIGHFKFELPSWWFPKLLVGWSNAKFEILVWINDVSNFEIWMAIRFELVPLMWNLQNYDWMINEDIGFC